MKTSLYSFRALKDLGVHYTNHVEAMTAEKLHDKSDIAAELAYRDIRIAELETAISDIMNLDRVDTSCLMSNPPPNAALLFAQGIAGKVINK